MPDRHGLLLDDPWTVSPSDFPADGSAAEKLRFVVHYAVLAPSILNTQPWRFRIEDNRLEMFTDPSRILPVTDPGGREMRISCGAALFNLRAALRGFGCDGEVTVDPGASPPDPLARIDLRGAVTPSEEEIGLRDAIPARRTDRRAFEDRPIPADLPQALADAARQEGALFALLQSEPEKHGAIDLVIEAERSLIANTAYCRELGSWIHERVGEATTQMSEVHARISGTSPTRASQPDLSVPSFVSVARMFPPGEEGVSRHAANLAKASAIGLLLTDGDTPGHWVAAGQALQRVLLTATRAGVHAAFLNAPTEIPELREQLARLFATDRIPQSLLRFGYAPPIAPTPRRPLRDIVT